jgi:hypothetical protein
VESALSVKDVLRSGLARVGSPLPGPVVVNSFGRAGSTLLFQAIVNSGAEASVLPTEVMRRSIWGEAWDLEKAQLSRGRCYKSHDYPPAEAKTSRVVYVFGDPLATVMSLVQRTERDGQAWLNSHAKHLKAQPTTPPELLSSDRLGLFEHLRAWVESEGRPALFVRYEELWNVVDSVNDHVGISVRLPARRRRVADRLIVPEETRDAYREFTAYVESLPDVFVTGGTIEK